MKILRSLIHDDVITNKILDLQVKYFEAICDSDKTSTEFLIDNNQIAYDNATTPEQKEALVVNVEQLTRNQQNRIDNSVYYEKKIQFMQDIFDLDNDDYIVVDEVLKEFIK